MTDAKARLRAMVDENISSIQVMSERMGLEMEEVIFLLNEMIGEGSLEGQVTPDGLRFFRDKVKVSDAPKIELPDEGPAFLRYDTRPGKIIAILGLAVLIIGLGVSYIAAETQSPLFLNVAMMLLGIGTILMMVGGCQVSRRPAPM
ncbi:MAG: hypothetical protein ACW960_15925 [Candidatus Thorarchaeota archaeon]|jgi:hypothetical protein